MPQPMTRQLYYAEKSTNRLATAVTEMYDRTKRDHVREAAAALLIARQHMQRALKESTTRNAKTP